MNDAIRASIIEPGIWAMAGVLLTMLVMAKDAPTETGWKFWQWGPHASFRLKALSIIIIGVATKTLLHLAFQEDGDVWGDIVMNLNSAIAGAYAARGWVLDTSIKNLPKTESTPHDIAASSPIISLTDEIDSAGNRKIAFTYQTSQTGG